MAVPEQTPYQEYTANGVATSFAVAFQCLSKDTLIVTINGVEQSSTLWSFTGGNIVFVSAPLNNSIVGIKRTTSLKREVTYNSYSNSMLPTVFNSDFDRIWHVLQEYQFSLDSKVATSRKINTSGNLQGGGSLEEDLTLSLKDQAVITDYQFGSSVKIPVITLNQDGTVKSIFESDLSGITPALTYIPWVNVLNKPTTLNGYGITNAYTKLEANAAFIEDAEKGVASGIAPLNANAKVDDAYLSAATESTKGAAMIASSISVKVAADDSRFVTPLKLLLGLKNHLNVSGDAPMFACRAWVNFNGTGTVAIRASGNVSSITDNGAGDYTINLTTALIDADFSVGGNAKRVNTSLFGTAGESTTPHCYGKTSSSFSIRTGTANYTQDCEIVDLQVVR